MVALHSANCSVSAKEELIKEFLPLRPLGVCSFIKFSIFEAVSLGMGKHEKHFKLALKRVIGIEISENLFKYSDTKLAKFFTTIKSFPLHYQSTLSKTKATLR